MLRVPVATKRHKLEGAVAACNHASAVSFPAGGWAAGLADRHARNCLSLQQAATT